MFRDVGTSVSKLCYYLYFSLCLSLFFSCTPEKKSNNHIFPKADQRPSDYLRSPDDFTYNKKDHLLKFLDENYERLSEQNLTYFKSKEKYLEEFYAPTRSRKEYSEDKVKQAKYFDKVFPKVYKGKLFNFYYQDTDHKKTFFYLQEPVSAISFYFEVYVKLQENLKDYNFIVVDTMRVLYREDALSAEEVNQLLIEDIEGFYKETGVSTTQKIFHSMCFAYALSYKLFEERKDLYDQVIYYTPYPIIGKDAELIRVDQLYKGRTRPQYTEYAHVGYLYYIARGQPLRSWTIPKALNTINFNAYYNLAMVPIKGRSLKDVKNKSLIHNEFEIVLTESSFQKHLFPKDKIRVLKNRYHNDFYWLGMKDYFEAINSLLE